ncbi:hypothetical protein BH18THE2_BH18THE2_31320 [soil metagenome]|jgi:hypothetical protein
MCAHSIIEPVSVWINNEIQYYCTSCKQLVCTSEDETKQKPVYGKVRELSEAEREELA